MKVEIARHFRWDRLAMAVGLLIGVPLALWGFYALGAYVPLRAEWPFNDAPPKVIYWIWATCAGIIKLLGGIVVLGMASLLVKVLIDCGLAVYFWLWGIDDQRR